MRLYFNESFNSNLKKFIDNNSFLKQSIDDNYIELQMCRRMYEMFMQELILELPYVIHVLEIMFQNNHSNYMINENWNIEVFLRYVLRNYSDDQLDEISKYLKMNFQISDTVELETFLSRYTKNF